MTVRYAADEADYTTFDRTDFLGEISTEIEGATI
jgi:hypothetical protein